MALELAPAPPVSPPGADPGRQRTLIRGYFTLSGIAMAVWAARLPDFRDRLHLSEGQIGTGLLAAAAGVVVALQVAGRAADRWSAARVLPWAGTVVAIALAGLTLPGSWATLVASLAVFGMAHGLLDVTMNTQAALLEQAAGRPLMSSCHAAYSVGGLAGAAASAAAAHAHVSAGTQFVVTALLLAAASLSVRSQLTAPLPRPGGGVVTAISPAPLGTRSARAGTLLLGGLVFCALLGEGGVGDWGPVQMHAAGHGTAVSAWVFGVFSAAMAAGRLAGDRFTAAVGTARVVTCCGVTTATGMLVALTTPTAPAMVGYALAGLGLSCLVPTLMSATAASTPAGQGVGARLARVSGCGYAGLVVGPAIIGGVATATSLRVGLGVIVVLGALLAAGGTTLSPRPRARALAQA